MAVFCGMGSAVVDTAALYAGVELAGAVPVGSQRADVCLIDAAILVAKGGSEVPSCEAAPIVTNKFACLCIRSIAVKSMDKDGGGLFLYLGGRTGGDADTCHAEQHGKGKDERKDFSPFVHLHHSPL